MSRWYPLIAMWLAIIALALLGASAAVAHPPNPGLAAGVFSARTSGMCPGGHNRGRCDYYGLARCRPHDAHRVLCVRSSVDYRYVIRLRVNWRAVGLVDHNYRVSNLTFTRL